MARINLLPWRQEERERKNKEFNVLIAAIALIAALIVMAAMTVLGNELSKQQEANQHIEQANAKLDEALKSIETLEAQRDQMLSQMKVIQDLQGRRSVPVRVWDDLARATPADMYLINIKRVGEVITIQGKADNADVVANFVRNLNASQWLDKSAVVKITSKIEAYQSSAPSDEPSSVAPPLETDYIEFEVTTEIQYAQEQSQSGEEGQPVEMPESTTDMVADDLANPIQVEQAPQEQGVTQSAQEPSTAEPAPAETQASQGGQQ